VAGGVGDGGVVVGGDGAAEDGQTEFVAGRAVGGLGVVDEAEGRLS